MSKLRAKLIIAAARKCGASAEMRGTNAVYVRSPGGLAVEIDAAEGAQALSWHIASGAATLSAEFLDVNPHHHRKATHFAPTFSAAIDKMVRGLLMASDGSAYRDAGDCHAG